MSILYYMISTPHEIFRLSATLYADNNYELSPKTIHKKIIESALLENNNQEMELPKLLLWIDKQYNLLFEESEVFDVLQHKTRGEGFEYNRINGETKIRLTGKRFQLLKEKSTSNNIEFYITEFEKLFSVKAKDVLYKYLYASLEVNVTGYQSIINPDKATDTINLIVDSHNFTDAEKNIVNNFLKWDNPRKNKCIFDLSNLALEYCILTNKSNASDFINLKNKKFYLDTNIFYRVLGINGVDRQKLTKVFIGKFKQAGEELFISKSTDSEFRASIKYYIDCIRKFNSPRVNGELFADYSFNEDIYNYYYRWKANRVNADLNLFMVHILDLYEKFVSEFGVVIDDNCPFDKSDDAINDQIKVMSQAIFTYKSVEKSPYYQSALLDAENIYWINAKREGKDKNINETVYFIISADQVLRKWDYIRAKKNGTIPIIMLPSQWLSVLLRFIDRTNDDFKSFVSFLNLRNNEQLISGEQLQIIIAGISEITSAIDIQKRMLDNLAEDRYEKVLEGTRDPESIFEKTKEYAALEMDKVLEELRSQNARLEGKVDNLSHTVAKEIKEKRKIVSSKDKTAGKTKSLLDAEVKKYNSTNKFYRDRFAKRRMILWRSLACLFAFISLLLVILLLLPLLGVECSWNYLWSLFVATDKLSSGVSGLYYTFYSAVIIGFITLTGRMIYLRFFKKDVINSKQSYYENLYEEKYVKKILQSE